MYYSFPRKIKRALDKLLFSINGGHDSSDSLKERIDAIIEENKATYMAGTLVKLAVENFHTYAEKRNIKLKLHLDPSAVAINVDSLRFEMVIQSLLSIALRATNDNGIIQIYSKNADNEYSITIQDFGSPVNVENIREHLGSYLHEQRGYFDKSSGSNTLNVSLGKSFIGKILLDDTPENGLKMTYAIPVEAAENGTTGEDFLEMTLETVSEMKKELPPEWNRITFQKNILLSKMYHFIKENAEDEHLNVETLASAFNRSRRNLYRFIREELDMTPAEMIREIRLEKAHDLLTNDPEITVPEVAYKTGYRKTYWFEKVFQQRFGQHPKQIK